MKLKYIRPLALALCAVLLCSLFTGMSPAASSSSEQPFQRCVRCIGQRIRFRQPRRRCPAGLHHRSQHRQS